MAEPRTLNELFFQAMDRFAGRPVVMRVKRDDRWTDLSYQDLLVIEPDVSAVGGAGARARRNPLSRWRDRFRSGRA